MPMRSELAVATGTIGSRRNRATRRKAGSSSEPSWNEMSWNQIGADGSVIAIVLFVTLGLILSIGAMLLLPMSDEVASVLALLS